MQGGYLDNDMKTDGGAGKTRERGGLIPITAKILNDAVVNQEEGVEYMGNLLSDVCIVGYLKDYNESDTKVKVRIWDHTGVVETIFYNKNESETHSGLANFSYIENNKLVKIFGTVKTYKKEKNLQGAKIMYVDDNEIINHHLEVINDWLYLTNKINTLKQESMEEYNNTVKNMAKSHQNNNNNNYGHSNHYGGHRPDSNANANNSLSGTDSIVLNTIQELSKFKNGRIGRNELMMSLERKNLSHGVIMASIRNLGDNGYLFEEDDQYCLQ